MADRRAELRTELTTAHDDILRMLDSLDAPAWGDTTYEGWSRKDTFAHLASILPRQRAQIQCALDGTAWNPTDDVNTYNEAQVAERKDWTTEQVRDEYVREQAATVELLDRISEADLDRTYQHPTRGARTVESVFAQAASHARNHANDIMSARSAATS